MDQTLKMNSRILVSLHLYFAIYYAFDSVTGHSHNLQDNNLKNYVEFNLVLKDALITRLTDHTFLDCLKECSKRPRCLSVNYFQHFLLCELNHKAGSADDLQRAREGSLFIRKQDFGMDDGFPQYTRDSIDLKMKYKEDLKMKYEEDLKMKYEEDLKGHLHSSVSDCGFPPAISNSKIDQSNGIGVYSKVIYECENGYKSTGRFKITCQENGQWSSTDFRCLKAKECGPGQEPRGDTCRDCLNGTYSKSTIYNNCEPCPTDQYQDQHASTTCMKCTYKENPCGEPYQLEGTNTTVVTNSHRTECRAIYDCKNSFEGSRENVYVKCHRDTSNFHWTKPYLSCAKGILNIPKIISKNPRRTHGCHYQQQRMTSYSSSIVKVKYKNGDLYCNHVFDGGNWTIIQQRTSGIGGITFDRNWNEFVNGFGSINSDYWLGNEMIHRLTRDYAYELLILLWKDEGINTRQQTARYKHFKIKDNNEKYKIYISDYEYETSDAGNVISDRNGYGFSTKDHDSTTLNCSVAQKAGWWHKTIQNNIETCLKGGNVNVMKWKWYYDEYDKSMILIRPNI